MNTAQRPDALRAGSTLQNGRYLIAGVLGAGGFGITYRASDTRLARAVAIKELCPSGCRRRGHVALAGHYPRDHWRKTVAAFLSEAQLLAAVDHVGIVPVYDYFDENNTAYMVMKYLDGVTLAARAVAPAGLPPALVLRYIAEVGAALGVLHLLRVRHGDIKPSNIMLLAVQDRPVLIDFGAARDFAVVPAAGQPIVATRSFAPPEQLIPGEPQGPYTDIYALAATCYWLLTRNTPATGDAASDPQLPPALQAALGHALAADPAARPAEVATFLAELQGRGARETGPAIHPATGAGPAADDYFDTEMVKPPSARTPTAARGPAVPDSDDEIEATTILRPPARPAPAVPPPAALAPAPAPVSPPAGAAPSPDSGAAPQAPASPVRGWRRLDLPAPPAAAGPAPPADPPPGKRGFVWKQLDED